MFKLDILGELASIGARLKSVKASAAATAAELNKVKGMLITETATGATVTFTDGADDMPMKSLTVAINAVQSGSGDPSPENIRPISEWTGANVTVNDGTIAVDWSTAAGAVYGGTLDVVSGVLTVTRGMVDLSVLSWSLSDATNHIFKATDLSNHKPTSDINYMCSIYAPIASNTSASNMADLTVKGNYTTASWLYVKDDRFDSVETFLAAIEDSQFVYELEAPLTYQLTPREVKTLLGSNTITANTGDSTVTYYADTKTYIDNAIAAAISALS